MLHGGEITRNGVIHWRPVGRGQEDEYARWERETTEHPRLMFESEHGAAVLLETIQRAVTVKAGEEEEIAGAYGPALVWGSWGSRGQWPFGNCRLSAEALVDYHIWQVTCLI